MINNVPPSLYGYLKLYNTYTKETKRLKLNLKKLPSDEVHKRILTIKRLQINLYHLISRNLTHIHPLIRERLREQLITAKIHTLQARGFFTHL